MTSQQLIKVRYNTSVMVAAGWRSETVTAMAKKISDKRCEVVEVLDVGGNGVTGYASRTGASRQKYCVGSIAKRECGALKIISKLKVIEE